MPSSWQSLVKRRAMSIRMPFLMLLRICWLPRLVADQQQPQAVVAQHFERRARHVGLGVARPGDAELAELAGDRLGARAVVGEGVVVEEELLDLREPALGETDLLDHVADAAHPVAMPADGLRPQAEGAFRAAAAPGVERHVGVLQIADEIVLDPQIALVDLGDEGQLVHVLEDRAIGVVDDAAAGAAIAQTVDRAKRPALGDLLDREVEFLAGDEVERAPRPSGSPRARPRPWRRRSRS